jgi:hypothetical protein
MKVSHQRSEALADHGHVQAHMRLGWRSRLTFVLSGLYIDTRHEQHTFTSYGHEDYAVLF